MECGGVQKSLLSLLNAIDSTYLNITLLLNEKKGAFLKFIPNWITIQELQYREDIVEEIQIGRRAQLRKMLRQLKPISLLKKYMSMHKEANMQYYDGIIHRQKRFNNAIINQEIFNQKYDLAVAYSDLNQMILVNDHIKANRKIAFLHNQLDKRPGNISVCQYLFENFDSVYCVSKDMTKYLINHISGIKDNVHYFPHILNVQMFKDWAQKYNAEWPGSGIKILSVGRITKQKGFDLIPHIAQKLRKDGINFQWLIIGEGDSLETLITETKEHNIYDYVKFCGMKENPYPYFATCDIYVQPSRYEGYCLTVAEARAFAKPIIATHFDGANEQLEYGRCGKIVDFSVNSLYSAIKELSENPNIMLMYRNALKTQKVNNSFGVQIFIEEINKSLTP